MKKLLLFLSVLAVLSQPIFAAADPVLEAVRKADDARIAAFTAGDRAELDSILSADLNYRHSSGTVDTKDSLMGTIAKGSMKFFSIDYEERKFLSAAPGIVLMSGRCHTKAIHGGKSLDLHLNYLSVWRNEGGAWRFLAWQSCRLPE
jgi:hypothetical protein